MSERTIEGVFKIICARSDAANRSDDKLVDEWLLGVRYTLEIVIDDLCRCDRIDMDEFMRLTNERVQREDKK